jgi:hypothetical protein
MPPLRLDIRVVENRTDLVPAAEALWEQFETAIRHPLTLTTVSFDVVEHGCDGEAFSRPYFALPTIPDWARFLLSIRLLTTSTSTDQHLTLLHECIHMDFAFGEHRARWQRLQAAIREAERQIPVTAGVDREMFDYLSYRHRVAILLRSLPDEIVAEKRMRRDYHDHWAAREGYYSRMRQRHEPQIVTGRPGDNLWPFSVFYELLRIQFFIPLTETAPARAELQRLEAIADMQLRAITSNETLEMLIRERTALLDAELDQPLTAAEAAHDRLFDYIMQVQKDERRTLRANNGESAIPRPSRTPSE